MQTDADKAAGVLRFTFGSEPAECRSLPYSAARQWLRGYLDSVDALGRTMPDVVALGDTPDGDMVDLAYQTADPMVDGIKAFDRGNTLPSREWIAEHATAYQLEIAIEDMKAAAAAPFVTALGAALIRRLQVDPSQPPSSTSGPSPTGDEPPGTSTTPSRRRK